MRREDKKHHKAMYDGAGMEHHETMRHHEKMRHHEAMKHHEAIHHYAQEKYQHEVDKPSLPPEGHDFNSMGCSDYKSDAMDIAYGQAGEKGCKEDGSKIVGQFKDYHWVD